MPKRGKKSKQQEQQGPCVVSQSGVTHAKKQPSGTSPQPPEEAALAPESQNRIQHKIVATQQNEAAQSSLLIDALANVAQATSAEPEEPRRQEKQETQGVDPLALTASSADLQLEDPCSISAEFFRSAMDSAPPTVESVRPGEPDPDTAEDQEESPALRRRRARFRYAIAPLLIATGVFAAIGVARSSDLAHTLRPLTTQAAAIYSRSVRYLASSRAATPPPATQKPALPVPPSTPAAAPAPVPTTIESVKPEPVATVIASASASATTSTVSAESSASAAPAASAPSADATKLRAEAESLLNRGRNKDAIEAARAAIQADPSHATAYLLLGTALQSSGKWKEGTAVFRDCAGTATRGPVWECRAFGGK